MALRQEGTRQGWNIEMGPYPWIKSGRCGGVSDAAGGASKGRIVRELASHGLCPEETGEPRRALTNGGGVSRLHSERPLWLLCGGFEARKQGTEGGSWWPHG